MGKEAKIGHMQDRKAKFKIRSLMLGMQERNKGDENLQYSDR